MFTKKLKIVKNGEIILESKITIILTKPHLFLPGDTFILFGSTELDDEFSIPKRSEVFLDSILMGLSGASGVLNIKSDRYTGTLHAVYLN